tara:strand:+ start:196 stop:558 length:363 start_codon:yes stop_codon:yes gene_type:complete
MDLDLQSFVHTLNSMGIQGIKRKFWLKIYNKDPKKAAEMFYDKLDRQYEGQRQWEIAKYLLLKKYPHFAGEPDPEPKIEPEPVPEPITYNLEYFLRINGGRWGCASIDIDEYERENGVVI